MTMLKTYRINLGWDITKLAEETGLAYNTIKRAETGRKITAENAKAIADALSKEYGHEIKPSQIDGLNIG